MAKILLLTPQLPYPPHQGTSLRNYHIIRGLAARHEITLLSLAEAEQSADPDTIGPLTDLCAHLETVPVPVRSTARRLQQLLTSRLPDMAHRLYSPLFNDRLGHLLQANTPDIVQIEGIELARAIGIVRVVKKDVPIVFDNHNAETALQWRNFRTDLTIPGRWPAAVYSWLQTRRLRRFEQWACEAADAVTAVSEADKQALESLTSNHRHPIPITVIPNCIDVLEYQKVSAETKQFDLLFSGKMDYRPNVDAVLWFADEIWPRIWSARPSTTVAIIGQKPHPRLARLRDVPGFTVTGWVENIRPYLAGAAVFIMPFRIGSGTRLKLIEAMAAGKAIVSTMVGAEGFPIQHNRELYLADTAEAFATAVLYLLERPDERQRLGQAAQPFAQRYDWRQVVPQFDEVYRQLQIGRIRDLPKRVT